MSNFALNFQQFVFWKMRKAEKLGGSGENDLFRELN